MMLVIPDHFLVCKVGGNTRLVVPRQLRKPILELAHQIPLPGHLGKEKTAKRILQRFYWPTVFHDVKEHCRACTSCQKSSARKVHPAPMIPLPVISEPFRRVAMDIVNPLPKSRSGNRNILVMCNYASIDGHPKGDSNGSRKQLHLKAFKRNVSYAAHLSYQDQSLPPPNRWPCRDV